MEQTRIMYAGYRGPPNKKNQILRKILVQLVVPFDKITTSISMKIFLI